jgi:hypothetical protein
MIRAAIYLAKCLSLAIGWALTGKLQTLCAIAHVRRDVPFWAFWAAFWDARWQAWGEDDHCANQAAKWR